MQMYAAMPAAGQGPAVSHRHCSVNAAGSWSAGPWQLRTGLLRHLHLPQLQRTAQLSLSRCSSTAAPADATPDEQTQPHRHTIELDAQDFPEGDYCMPGEITVDNESNPNFTVLELEVKDYPGLLRVITWVLNGLELIVENARLTTTPDGMARNTFWVTNTARRKLPNDKADLLAERVGDFVIYCTPNRKEMEASQLSSGPIHIDNTSHPEFTVITLTVPASNTAALLDVASVMSGTGVSIHEAIVQSCTDCGGPVAEPQFDHAARRERLFKFWVTDRRSAKLDYARASALVYTLGLVFGRSNGPITPPNRGLVAF